MEQLNKHAIPSLPSQIETPDYDLDATTCGIVHIGPGAFHRAHQAVYTDLALSHGGNWRIHGVSMRSNTLKEALDQQDCLYSLAVLDTRSYIRIIGAIAKVSVLADERETVMDALCSADTHVVTMTVTEKGYCLDSEGQLDFAHPDIIHDLEAPESTRSAIGLLVEALRIRKQQGRASITIISCDNLSDNGTKLGHAVLALAKRRDPELSDWIEDNICFPNTMVDSITPATDQSLKDTVSQTLKVKDAWPIQREAFCQWVIEDKFSGPRPAWEKVGVTLTSDVHAYEKAKLRVLNGTHSSLAYLGILFDKETVNEAIQDPYLKTFIDVLLAQEILPSVADFPGDIQSYSDSILARYRNANIRHLLSQIAWDGTQKLPFRILSTVRDNLEHGRPIRYLCRVIAAWILFLIKRVEEQETIVDPEADFLANIVHRHRGNSSALASEILRVERVFSDLSNNMDFHLNVLEQMSSLERRLAQQCNNNLKESL